MPLFPTTSLINSTLSQFNTGHYLALYTSSPNAGGGGTEVAGGSYARQAITFGSIVAGAMSNSSEIVFSGLPTANVTHYSIISAASGGTMKAYGPLSATAASVSGDQIKFAVGALNVSLSGS